MKKIVTTLLIAAMLTGTLAGCAAENSENSGAVSDTGNSTSSAESGASSNENSGSSVESSTSSAESSTSSAESSTSSAESSTSSAEGSTSSTESSTSSAESSTSSAEGSGTSSGASSSTSSNESSDTSSDTSSNTSSGESGTSEGAGSSVEEGKSPVELLNAVFSQFEMFSKPGESMLMQVGGPDKDAIRAVFPEFEDPEKPTHCVWVVEDGAMIAGMIGLTQLNLGDCEDYVVAGPMISMQLKRFVIAKPKAGREDAVKEALSEYAEASKNPPSDGWMGYPSWEAERAGTYFGETADGCYYVVVAAEGAEMGSAIENA